MTELSEVVRRELRVLAEKENIELLHDPDYRAKVLTPMLKKIAESVANEEEDDISEVDELYDAILADLLKQYSNEEQIKEVSESFANTLYNSREEVKAGFEKVLLELGEDMEPEWEIDFKKISNNMLNGIQKSFDFNDEVISKLTEIADKEGIEKTITVERRNSVIKAVFPNQEEYVELFTINAEAVKKYLADMKAWAAKVDGEEPELEIEDAIAIAMSDIGKEMWSYRAKKIYE